MKLYQIALLPLGWLYAVVIQIRNWLYEQGLKKSFRFDTVVISIGNLTVGGTGKTPLVEYIVRRLTKKFIITTLSRGYKRKTKGFRLATQHDTALTLGDEPYQLYRKFVHTNRIHVAVGEERLLAIPEILARIPNNNVILLDDAFQHRKIQPNLHILLTDFYRPFFSDYVLPVGRLREPRKEAHRADVVVVTKCPTPLDESTKDFFRYHISSYYTDKVPPIFFTGIRYGKPMKIGEKQPITLPKNVLLITGIANPTPLVTYVAQHYHLIKHIAFSDHHRFTKNTIRKFLKAFHSIQLAEKCLLTTEKDSVRLMDARWKSMLEGVPIYYLPIDIVFLEGKLMFDQIIFKTLEQQQ
ncbi:MAG: tetraacyldisaccharide 4'-kinase [Cytophagales bacterium]|nr:tetraacyldisaccharide 4'-kinase [Cytophagales bacterium]